MDKLKLSKKQIKRIAEIYSAMVIINSDRIMFNDTENISENDQDMILEEIHKLSTKISKIGDLRVGTVNEIINLVINS